NHGLALCAVPDLLQGSPLSGEAIAPLQAEGFGGDQAALAHHHGPPDPVDQLPDVARPGVLAHGGQALVAEATHPAGGFAPELLEEVGGQLLDVLWPLPEGGCPCLQDVEPMVEVLAKAPLPDGALQVDMGRGKHSDIHLALTLGAQAQEAVILEEA